ncbi:hypothetical protein [Cohaesibacter haloalkalitolerans]|uniref:hypothetical protein n=1 Tax=Cohaesibacter haloalkalitolerans TaxID=1162980 RepID=UPI000E64BCA4|nr:hypothetical protein [Cohaesibacter haloalkalitolerans]
MMGGMEKIFEPYDSTACCLCGSRSHLSGEHKIKASQLRKQFGIEPMLIGSFDGRSKPKFAQGPKSKAFHFSAPVCVKCNSLKTQNADKAFDQFHQMASEVVACGSDPKILFSKPEWSENTNNYLDLYRFFAKQLACQIAQSNGPRFKIICDFAIGMSRINPIQLFIDRDPAIDVLPALLRNEGVAGHGGLQVCYGSFGVVCRFGSSLTIGEMRYNFAIGLAPIVGLALRIQYPNFEQKCKAAWKALKLE